MRNPDDADDYVDIQPDTRPTIIETPQKQTARMLLFASEAVEAGMYEEAYQVASAARLKIIQLIGDRMSGNDSYSDIEKDRNNVKKHL